MSNTIIRYAILASFIAVSLYSGILGQNIPETYVSGSTAPQAHAGEKKSPPGKSPGGRSQHGAAYDIKRASMLIFGGQRHFTNKELDPHKVDNTLWAWKNHWIAWKGDGPGLREDCKMVYHSNNEATYLYGGRSYDGTGQVVVSDEFWEWNGSKWKLIRQEESPGKRLHTGMVYDTERNKVIIFGGAMFGGGFSNDLWEWDGTVWRNIHAQNHPPSRIAHTMVYSSALGKTIILGGINEKGEELKDMWTWDGRDFILLNDQLPPIENSAGNAVSMDHRDKVQILLCGNAKPLDNQELPEKDPQTESWMWDGRQWKNLNLAVNPTARQLHTMVYDPTGERVILFGGSSAQEGQYHNPDDMWIFQNAVWTKQPVIQ